jgi:hypothetical protein
MPDVPRTGKVLANLKGQLPGRGQNQSARAGTGTVVFFGSKVLQDGQGKGSSLPVPVCAQPIMSRPQEQAVWLVAGWGLVRCSPWYGQRPEWVESMIIPQRSYKIIKRKSNIR